MPTRDAFYCALKRTDIYSSLTKLKAVEFALAAATTNIYNAGYNAGAATATAAASYAPGQIVATLPAGCAQPTVNGQTYYLCGNTWFSPANGANGVYYTVVPTP